MTAQDVENQIGGHTDTKETDIGLSGGLKAELAAFRALEKDRTYSGWSPARTEAVALIDKILAELGEKP